MTDLNEVTEPVGDEAAEAEAQAASEETSETGTALVPAVRKKVKRLSLKKIKVLRTLSLDTVAAQMADDMRTAIYSSVGNRTIYDETEGDDLENPVQQSIDRHGMSSMDIRLSSTRIEIKIGVDGSGSMFQRGEASPILRGTTVLRLIRNACGIVSQQLPSNVFKSSSWLWALSTAGRHTVCLDDPKYGTLTSAVLSNIRAEHSNNTDKFLEKLGRARRWQYWGGGTQLAPLLKQWRDWEQVEGSPNAHRMDIVVTDGMLYDTDVCSQIQAERMNSGRYRAVLLNISGREGNVPQGFTGFHIGVLELENWLKEEIFEFVKQI